MESDRRYLVRHKAIYDTNGWYWGEDADMGTESTTSLYLGEHEGTAAMTLKHYLHSQAEYEEET